jgi:hypothetical protein
LTLAARPFGGSAVEQLLMAQRRIGNQATLLLLAQRATNVTGNEPRGHNEQDGALASLTPRGTTHRVVLRQATGGSNRKLQIFEPRPADLQRLVDAADKIQRYVGATYNNLAAKTSDSNPVAGVFYPEVSRIDGDVGELGRQAQLGVQQGGLPAQQYADIIYGLSSAKKKLDDIQIRARLARPARGGQVVSEFIDPWGEIVDLTDVNKLMLLLGRGVIPGTSVEY